jgi:hypothetical protein
VPCNNDIPYPLLHSTMGYDLGRWLVKGRWSRIQSGRDGARLIASEKVKRHRLPRLEEVGVEDRGPRETVATLTLLVRSSLRRVAPSSSVWLL